MELFIGISASLIAALIGGVMPKLIKDIRLRRIYKALPSIKKNVAIVFAGLTGLKPEWDKDLFVHSEAIYTLPKITKLFSSHNIDFIYQIDSELRGDDLFDLEICIGGYVFNKRTKAYMDKYCDFLYVQDGHSVDKNEALIIKLKLIITEYGKYRDVILLYGRDPLDTYCAIDYFCNNFNELIKYDFKNDNIVIRLRAIKGERLNYAEFIKKENFD